MVDVSPRLALLGLGGIGKTSTALAVLHHSDIASRFESRRFWVPCVKAKSVEEFESTLHAAIIGARDTSNARSDVMFYLKTLPSALIILDNFETPWSIEIGRAHV